MNFFYAIIDEIWLTLIIAYILLFVYKAEHCKDMSTLGSETLLLFFAAAAWVLVIHVIL